MTEHIVNLLTAMEDKHLISWLGLNGIDPETVLASELTVHEGEITYTEFFFIYEEGKPRRKVFDERRGGYKKHHRTVPMIVDYVGHVGLSNRDETTQEISK